MPSISYVKIENFKGFKKEVYIRLSNPSVLIGPNNSGKTTAIQALSLWSRAVREWYNKKGDSPSESQKRYGVGINRLTILDIPVKESRYFWNETHIREGSKSITFSIEAGVIMDGKEYPAKMIFNSRDQESVYCRPDKALMKETELLKYVRNLSFNLLYPMSGIASGIINMSPEFLVNDGRMNVYLGQGQTSHVLRNLCYKINQTSKDDWEKIARFLELLFQVKLQTPELDETTSVLSLSYLEYQSSAPLEIALAGRGMQQVLLILAYLYSHKNSVLMIDEPDAHLELLRQKQIFTILQDVALQTDSQIIIATHSEVILDESVETNLSFILNGECIELSRDDVIKHTLRNLGMEHYYKAKISPHLLIVEGSTDVMMLRAFAQKLNHPVLNHLNDRLFTYYIKDVSPERDVCEEIQRQATPTNSYKEYYYTLKQLVKELNGLVILDSDGKEIPAQNGKVENDLLTMYWRRYEIENYFISPELLMEYAKKKEFNDDLFILENEANMKKAIDDTLAEMVYNNDHQAVEQYYSTGEQTKQSLLAGKKMSEFAEKVFRRFADLQKQPILLNKGQYYQMIEYMDPSQISPEIKEKLDAMQSLFETTPQVK